MGLSFLLAVAVQQKRMKRRSMIRRRRQREIQKSETWVARQIPLDLLVEILTRLPPKSVMRFKCISKFWSSLFSSRYFCDHFLMVPSRPQPRLYMSLWDKYKYSKSVLLSSAPSTCVSPLVFDTIRMMGGFFLRVLRGFICFTYKFEARIYNPTTTHLLTLPFIEESDIVGAKGVPNTTEVPCTVFYFICHDPVNDKYKILCTITLGDNELQNIKSELWIFVLEAGGSWKRIAKDFPHHLPSDLERNINGLLYYLAWTDSYTCLLVSFDARSEEFSIMMQVPRKAGDTLPRCKKGLTQLEYGGKLAIIDFTFLTRCGTMELWVLEDAKKKEWSRKSFVLRPSQKHLVTPFFVPKGTTRDGKLILVPQNLFSPFYILYYDLQLNDLIKVEIKGVPNHWFSKPERDVYLDMEFMDPSESIMCLEI